MAIESVLSQAPFGLQSSMSEGGSRMAVDGVDSIAAVQTIDILAVDISQGVYAAQGCNCIDASDAVNAVVGTDSHAVYAVCNSISHTVYSIQTVYLR